LNFQVLVEWPPVAYHPQMDKPGSQQKPWTIRGLLRWRPQVNDKYWGGEYAAMNELIELYRKRWKVKLDKDSNESRPKG
jgi:hypothetical protein